MDELKQQLKKGEKVRTALFKQRRKQRWLIEELRYVGVYTNASEMSNVLVGLRKGPKADKILDESLKILGC